MVKQPALDHST
ncbi:hypothetical protein AVEN_90619-1, partial [Araneus ventricosus]